MSNKNPMEIWPHVDHQTRLILYISNDLDEALDEAFTRGDVSSNEFACPHTSCGGMTLLHFAVTTQKLNMVKILVKHKVDCNVIETNAGYTPLFFAAMQNQIEIVK